MEEALLKDSPVGQLVPIAGTDARFGDFSCSAFLPHDLPSHIDFSNVAWNAIVKASSAIARLDEACSQLPRPDLLIRPALWREALDTSALEGTYGQLSDILESKLEGSGFESPETREILAYEEVAQSCFKAINTRPITVGLLCDAQRRLFQDLDRQPRDVGEIRSHQVWIGPEHESIEQSRFVPPPGDDRLKAAMDAWVRWIDTQHDLPTVAKAALAHYQFETLHPFGDGNGRIGRLAAVLVLLRTDELRFPAVTISPWFLRRRTEYQNKMFELSCRGDWSPWVEFFCQAISEQCQRVIDGASKLRQWLSDSRQVLSDRRWSGKIVDVLETLAEWPVIDIATISARQGVSPPASTKIVRHLTEAGILEEITGKKIGRRFAAKAVIEIVEDI